jgi:hypothetical protein
MKKEEIIQSLSKKDLVKIVYEIMTKKSNEFDKKKSVSYNLKQLEKKTKKELIQMLQKVPKKNIISLLIKQSGGEYKESSEIRENKIIFNKTKNITSKNNVLHNNNIYNNIE